MKDETLSSSGRNDYPEYDRNPKKLNGTGILFLITTIVFLGAAIFLFAENSKKTKESTVLTTDLSASEARYADLDAKFTAALVEIESFKGKNATLDSVLSVRETYILNLKSNLGKEKKKREMSESEYKKQLTDLNTMITDLSTRVDSLQKENSMLIVQKDSLGRDITEKQVVITDLETSNTTLTQKVTVASLLVPTDIEVMATRDKSSGKESETSRASKAQHIKVCFNVPENKVSDPGTKTFMVRILNPQGAVLAVENQGSGTFTSVENGQQMQYSVTTNLEYQNQAKEEVCTNFTQTTPFVEGKYSAEIYQDGYLVGKEAFELK